MNEYYYDRQGNLIDYYSIFNISYHAEVCEIKSAFRALIKRYHPDTAEQMTTNTTEKIDLIIHGYRILVDQKLREEYDLLLFKTHAHARQPFPIIPKKRIKYSASLSKMLQSRFFPRGLKHKDILRNFGQDIEIFITPLEARRGARAYITLPARMHCPYCSGRDHQCYVCKGIGRISTTSQLEVTIPPNIENNTLIDVDLMKLKPDTLTRFRGKSTRIRITIEG